MRLKTNIEVDRDHCKEDANKMPNFLKIAAKRCSAVGTMPVVEIKAVTVERGQLCMEV